MAHSPKRPVSARAGGGAHLVLLDKARVHADAAIAALAEIAEGGASEASRVAAANALLDRGFGKASAAPASTGADDAQPAAITAVKWID